MIGVPLSQVCLIDCKLASESNAKNVSRLRLASRVQSVCRLDESCPWPRFVLGQPIGRAMIGNCCIDTAYLACVNRFKQVDAGCGMPLRMFLLVRFKAVQ